MIRQVIFIGHRKIATAQSRAGLTCVTVRLAKIGTDIASKAARESQITKLRGKVLQVEFNIEFISKLHLD